MIRIPTFYTADGQMIQFFPVEDSGFTPTAKTARFFLEKHQGGA